MSVESALHRSRPALPQPTMIDVETMYRRHAVRLTRLATAITLDRSVAEEVVQDAFAGLHRRAATIDRPEAYLQRSVVNLSVKVLRRRRVADRQHLDPPPLTHLPELDDTWSAVVQLPPRQRAVVALRFWEELSEGEMAEVLGWPAGTIKSTLHRALRRLKEELQP